MTKNKKDSPEVTECKRIAKEYRAKMLEQTPSSKAAHRYANLSDGALACAIHIGHLQKARSS